MDVGADGGVYKAVQHLCSCLVLKLICLLTGSILFRLQQGDVLSPTLFLLFVSELALHIKETNAVICLDDTNLGFLNGCDIISRAESESDLDNMLNAISVCCHKWKLAISQSKPHK